MRRSNPHLVVVILVLLSVLAAAPRARADESDEEPDEPYTVETWPVELVRRPLTLAAGMLEIGLLANVNLTKGFAGEPISLAPSVAYGINERLTISLDHVQGFCLSGKDSCRYIYNDTELLLRWSALRQGPWEIAAQGGLAARHIQPDFQADLVLRAAGRWHRGRLAVTVEPFIDLGLTDRDQNATVIGVTGRADVQATNRLAVFALVKVFGAVDDLGGTYLIPSGLGLLVALGRVDVGGEIVFPALLGPNDNAFFGLGKLDQREGQVFLTVRF